MTIGEKIDKLKAALAAVEKHFGMGAAMILGQAPLPTDVPVIPSGSLALDIALGTFGYPRGRIVEIFGPESSGKTTLALHAIAEVQKQGGVCGFIDAEHALDVTYAKKLGVDADRLLVSQPDHGEQALGIADVLITSGAVDLIVVDSVAALTPKAELEGEMGDNHVGLHARLMSQAMRKLTGGTHRSGATLMFINQIRQKIGVMFGSPETTTGGNALKFYASVRLDVRRLGAVKSKDATGEKKDAEVIGNSTRVKVVKNKLAPPFRVAEFEILYGQGVNRLAEILEIAAAMGVVKKSGAHFSFEDEKIGYGRDKALEALANDPEKFGRIEQAVRANVLEKTRSGQTVLVEGEAEQAA
ncbi:MAG: recombinase RecA [Myxococcota bacterium]|jgi:recombination protein RecA|nr:recombinase RecA [Myxococcota bacterium]